MGPMPRIVPALLLAAAAAWGCSGGSDGGSGAAPGALPPLPTPNVVLVILDDLGYGDLGCFGSQDIATPNIDAIAARGKRLTSFYASSICTPSRAALMTGKYPPRVSMPRALGPWSRTGLSPSETTIAEVLRGAGYRTALFGKWHLGDSPDQLPTAQGFDEFAGLPWGPTGTPVIEVDSVSGQVTYGPDPVTQTRRATTRAIDFIERAAASGTDPRFLCVVSYVAPHEPAAARPEFQGSSADGRDFGDAVQEVDFEIGRLADRLRALGLEDNTLLLVCSDNGAGVGGAAYHNGSNGPLRGGKAQTLEGGVRVPAVVQWPAVIEPGGALDVPLHAVDLAPTLASLARRPVPGPLDGRDVGHVLSGDLTGIERDLFFSDQGTFEAVRRGRFKLRRGELYDLEMDPGESTDLAATRAALAAELQAALDAINAEVATNFTEAGVTTRISRVWRGDTAGLPMALGTGAVWTARAPMPETFTAVDEDPAADLVVVEVNEPRRGEAPGGALELGAPSDAIRLTRSDPALDGTGPFTLELWYRAPAGGATEPLALLDVGGAGAGLSVTLGDGGVQGDDLAEGQLDDLRVRVGGALAGADSRALTADLPASVTDSFIHVVVARLEDGSMTLALDGVTRDAIGPGPSTDWSPASTWSLFAPEGDLGGAGGGGARPFSATRSAGALAGLAVFGRGLRPDEVSLRSCRFARIDYCFARPNSTGGRASLGTAGSHDLLDGTLTFEVTGAPPGTFGFLMAGSGLERVDVGQGTICLGAPVVRLDGKLVEIDGAGTATFGGDVLGGIPGLDPGAPEELLLQFWFRDVAPDGSPSSNTTNATQIRFCQG